MPTFRQPVGVAPRDGSRFQHVIALVDTEYTFAVMPSPLLSMLGVLPGWRSMFELAGGAQEEHALAEVRFRINEMERTTVCVFGTPNSQPILGKHTLDTFGLRVNEAGRGLVPARFYLG